MRKPISPADGGPRRWLVPFLEARYTKLSPKAPSAAQRELESKLTELQNEAVRRMPHATTARPDGAFESVLQPGRAAEVLADVRHDYWYDAIVQYRRRQAHARRSAGAPKKPVTPFHGPTPAVAGIPGANNWISIGPSVVLKGQAGGRPGVSGRASGIAIAPSVSRVYVATADGGVWRSDDAGSTWTSTMDDFDQDPTAFAATSLACGAIAIDPAAPDRVYVGTGEGDTNSIFNSRLVESLPTYRGVGPLRSDDGGATWANEPAASTSPTLAGSAFYQLAVDPADRENVVAATNVGLYHREPDGSGGYWWVQRRAGIHCSVVAARAAGVTTFFAAAWADAVYSSADGITWSAAGAAFPTGVSRIALAARTTSPNVLYAMTAAVETVTFSTALGGVYRLDGGSGPWKKISGAPSLGAQCDYNLAIVVDPNDADVIYVGGQASGEGAALYRAHVSPSGAAYAMVPTLVGANVHADVHAVVYAPGDSDTLFVCCDGGVFKTATASASASFRSCNTGLATLCTEFIAQHPTEPAVMLAGLQDNGTARYTGEECWTSVNTGDGGYCAVNWNKPFEVLTYADGSVYRAIDGAQGWKSWSEVTPDGSWQILSEPLVGTPYNAFGPFEADTVALGVGNAVYVSGNFGKSWKAVATVTGGPIFAMAFASAVRLFVGTTQGSIFRLDDDGSAWSSTRLDDASGGALPLTGLVTDIEVDLTDPTMQAIYVAFGGAGDYRHVWHFDGSAWEARSGPSAGAMSSLLDVSHNALVVDPNNPGTVYAGADIGVWATSDGGANWTLVENGLPDAAVLDLQIHQPSRLLRAATYGRGVFQYKLDPPAPPDQQLYVRDTTYDLGLTPTVDGTDDYARWPTQPVVHWESPNIKVDVPTPAGYQTAGTDIDFFVFNDLIVDGSGGVAALDPSSGTVTNRVYVEAHTRGVSPVSGVQVMLLLANASATLPPLPAGYTAHVQAGTPISSALWQTVGFRTIATLRNGIPEVVEFALPSSMLPPPASLPGQSHYCLLALLHSPADPFTNPEVNTDALTVNEPKAAQRNLQIVQFVGAPPPSSAGSGMWAALQIHNYAAVQESALVFDLLGFPGRVGAVLPRALIGAGTISSFETAPRGAVRRYVAQQRPAIAKAVGANRFSAAASQALMTHMSHVVDEPLVLFEARKRAVLPNIRVPSGTSHTVLVNVQGWAGAKVGDRHRFRVYLRDPETNALRGGTTYHVEVVAKQPEPRR